MGNGDYRGVSNEPPPGYWADDGEECVCIMCGRAIASGDLCADCWCELDALDG